MPSRAPSRNPCVGSGPAIHARAPGRARGLSHHVMIGMINSATMLATLIIGLMAGPAVSL
jgi:hypothetical protein